MLSSLTPLKPLMAFQCFSGFPLLITLEKTLLTQAAAACVFWPLPPAQLCLSRPPRLSGRPQGRSSSWAQAFCTCSSPWPGYFWPFYFREILLDPPDLIRRLSMRGFTLCHLTSTAGWGPRLWSTRLWQCSLRRVSLSLSCFTCKQE